MMIEKDTADAGTRFLDGRCRASGALDPGPAPDHPGHRRGGADGMALCDPAAGQCAADSRTAPATAAGLNVRRRKAISLSSWSGLSAYALTRIMHGPRKMDEKPIYSMH